VPVPALGFGTLRGWLRGYIDLVCAGDDGRHWVLDWKSNHLGWTPPDYAGAALERAMAQHGYHLQALLYAVALHRHLRQRLPGYRYARDFGGVLYLFVRGLRPGWEQPDGTPGGVVRWQPPQALVEALSDRLEATEAGP
jgi:exodeoxyribonuclease V beta subunit